jgi:hypothetical protein
VRANPAARVAAAGATADPLRRMIHLVALPDQVIGSKSIRAGLAAVLAGRPELTARAEGPRRVLEGVAGLIAGL